MTPTFSSEHLTHSTTDPHLTRRQMTAGFLICLTPLLLLLFSNDWLFTTIGYIDPWHYVGFFNFYDHPEYSSGAYKLARLPWILIGWLVNQLLPTLAAAMALHAIFLVAATTGMFALAWLLFRSYPLALIAAAIVGFHPGWHASGGWDYHNTAAGAAYVWALVAVTMAARTNSPIRDGLAGVAAALAVHCNITYACFLPVLGVHYLVVARARDERWPELRRVAAAIGSIIAGAVLITAVLSAVNVLVGREALFFRTLFEITLRYTKDTTNLAAWWHPWSSGWFWLRQHLALPTAVLMLSPVTWWAARRGDHETRMLQRLVVAEFVAMALVWSAWQFAGNLTLDWDYFFYPLLPHVFLALVAFMSATMRPVHWSSAVGTVVLLLGTLVAGVGGMIEAHQSLSLAAVAIVTPLVLFFLAGVGGALAPSRWKIAVFVTLFALGNTVSKHTELYSAVSPCHITADEYRVVVDTMKLAAAPDPSMRRTRLWFDENEATQTTNGCSISVAQIGYSLAGTGVGYLATPFPMTPLRNMGADVFTGAVQQEATIIIPSVSDSTVRRFRDTAAAVGIDAVETGQQPFRIGDAKVLMTFLKLRTDPGIVERAQALPGDTLAEWRNSDELVAQLGINAYGSRREVVRRGPAGEKVFDPATPQDHLASGFMAISSGDEPHSLLISAVPGASRPVLCSLFVQDQNMKTLAEVPCGRSTATEPTLVKLLPDVRQIRIYFLSPAAEPMVLPQQLTITEHDGPVETLGAAAPGR